MSLCIKININKIRKCYHPNESPLAEHMHRTIFLRIFLQKTILNVLVNLYFGDYQA